MTQTPPPLLIRIAATRAELARFRHAELTGMVAVLLNRFRGHGDPEHVCKAFEPSLTEALGAWWDQHYTCTEALPPSGDTEAPGAPPE